MKRWKDCRGTPQRMAALRAAFEASAGQAKRAAVLLGVDRSYLYDILRTHGDPRLGVGGVGAANADSSSPRVGGVGRSPENSLRYRDPTPTLRGMPAATTERGEQVELLTVEIPKRCKDWLELEAVMRKQRGEIPRSAMKTIVVELIEAAMAKAGVGQED